MNPLLEPVAPNSGYRKNTVSMGRVMSALLMPHAPVLVPAVAGPRTEAAATSRAMREAAAALMRLHPDSIAVISPHSPRRPGAFGLWAEDRLIGSLEAFGAPEVVVNLPNDRCLANALAAEAHARTLETWFIRKHSLDYGALVPLHFLVEAGWTGPTILLSLNDPEADDLTRLGEAIAAAAGVLPRRVAVIASGDMSHRLTANAPCDFHPDAHRFDETFIQFIERGDYRKVLDIKPALRELAAEDAVDSTVVAVAAAGWSADGHKFLSYEKPFGVGYAVAILYAAGPDFPPPKLTAAVTAAAPLEALPDLARQSVTAALSGSGETCPPAPEGRLSLPNGVFVTIRHRTGKLRGCVGTIAPVWPNVVVETWHNARKAALEDARFSPVREGELDDLVFQVSLIHPPHDVASPAELDPQRYGVIISTEDGRRGILLSGLESVTTAGQQLRLARKKAWIGANEPVKIQRFLVDHFTETT